MFCLDIFWSNAKCYLHSSFPIFSMLDVGAWVVLRPVAAAGRGRGPAWTRQRWRGGPRLRLRLQRRMHFGALLNWADPAPSPRPIALQNTSLYLLKAEKKYITKHINGQINIFNIARQYCNTLKMTAQRLKTLLSEQTSRLKKCVWEADLTSRGCPH